MSKPFVVDLFSGCGGFGLGAELAGFDCKLAVDIDQDLQSSYSLNFPNSKTILKDIRKITESDWSEWLKDQQPDGIIGGPPCQGFSRIGKREKNDPRNSLIGHFFRHVMMLKPKFFIMENVEGLLDEGTKEFLTDALEPVRNHYTILEPMIINAADYGAPTNRKRVVIVGYDAMRMEPVSQKDFVEKQWKKKVTVRSAIGDLPSPIPGSAKLMDYCYADTGCSNYFSISKYAQRARKAPPTGLGNEKAIKMLEVGKVSGFHETAHSEAVARRYAKTRQGHVDRISKSHRLSWRGQCVTLRAGTGSDKGSFQAVRPLHPSQGRVITVREAARLQGFPDWFLFHPTKWHSFRMIGNSVSPIISKILLSVIKKKFS